MGARPSPSADIMRSTTIGQSHVGSLKGHMHSGTAALRVTQIPKLHTPEERTLPLRLSRCSQTFFMACVYLLNKKKRFPYLFNTKGTSQPLPALPMRPPAPSAPVPAPCERLMDASALTTYMSRPKTFAWNLCSAGLLSDAVIRISTHPQKDTMVHARVLRSSSQWLLRPRTRHWHCPQV